MSAFFSLAERSLTWPLQLSIWNAVRAVPFSHLCLPANTCCLSPLPWDSDTVLWQCAAAEDSGAPAELFPHWDSRLFFRGFPHATSSLWVRSGGRGPALASPQKTAVSPRALWMRHRGAGREPVCFPETRRTWVNETSFSNISAMIRKHTCSLPDEKEQQLDR